MNKTACLPIDEREATRLFLPLLTPGEAVGLAVSGGADSMALALCAKAAGLSCRAFLVDHDLRPESGEEAALVKQRLEALGIETDILFWTHDEIHSRVHVEARKARYALLADACRRHGLNALLIAHHRDDQAETILMRLAKGSGVDGLAGMAAVTAFDELRLVRPFLKIPKARLVATCEAQGVAFVTDPSNAKTKYARGRLRIVWEALAQEGLTAQRLTDLGERAGEAAQAVAFYAEKLLQEKAQAAPGGAIRLDLVAWRAAPRAVGLKVLALILSALHRTDYAPERKGLVGLDAFLAAVPQGAGRSLQGCLIRTDGEGAVATFMRDAAAITDVGVLRPGETVLWDGRWRVTLPDDNNPSLRASGTSAAIQGTVEPKCGSQSSGLLRSARNDEGEEGLDIRPLGLQPHELLDRLAPGLRRVVPQGRVRAALPALWRDGELVAIPAFLKQNQAVATASLLPLRWR